MVDIGQTTIKAWDYLKIGTTKFRDAIMWVAELIEKYTHFPANNIFLIILGLIAYILVSKIFYAQNTTIRGRGLDFIVWLIIIFLLLRYL